MYGVWDLGIYLLANYHLLKDRTKERGRGFFIQFDLELSVCVSVCVSVSLSFKSNRDMIGQRAGA